MRRIGVMLDQNVLRRAAEGKPTYERLHLYQDIGRELGLLPVFFHPLDVFLRSRRVRGYVWNGRRLVRETVPLPDVLHNRVLSGHRRTNEMIRQLTRLVPVYNARVPRDKAKVHELLSRNMALRPNLPDTVRFRQRELERFINRYRIVYVKPAKGSVGRGVARLERQPDRCLEMISARRKELVPFPRLRAEMSRWVGTRRFIVQQGIPLARYEDQPFDIRVSVQKNGEGVWVVSGMVAKVANPRNSLSNLAQGGKAVSLDRVLATLFASEQRKKVKEEVARVALAVAHELERHSGSLADLGLDMGIDEEGHPYLIEVNVRDQRYSFYKAGEYEMFERTYRHPLEYGKRLLSTY